MSKMMLTVQRLVILLFPLSYLLSVCCVFVLGSWDGWSTISLPVWLPFQSKCLLSLLMTTMVQIFFCRLDRDICNCFGLLRLLYNTDCVSFFILLKHHPTAVFLFRCLEQLNSCDVCDQNDDDGDDNVELCRLGSDICKSWQFLSFCLFLCWKTLVPMQWWCC